ncbi:MAG: hypothetical protein IK997_03230 [Bacilli bacterium]|nr:hypothetical protein [Bacilli bacterium]
MNTNYRNKLITMSDGEQYVVLSEASYKGKTYALANDIINNNLGSNMTLFRIEDLNGELNFVIERDLDIVSTILTKMA